MVDFSQLPNEMISEIWGQIVEPRDVESFALVSKLIYAIGGPFVAEHNALVREYSRFDTNDTRASDLLKNVLIRPRVALYVTNIAIVGYWWDTNGYSSDDVDVDYPPYPDDVMAMFIEAIQKTSILPPRDVQYSMKQIRFGNEDPIFALLLLLLPNISTITLKDRGWIDLGLCSRTIQRIAEAKQTKFLLRLRTVNIEVSRWLLDKGCECITQLARLPLGQSMDIRFPSVSVLHDVIRQSLFFLPDTSKITTLTLSCDELSSKLVLQLSKSITGLVKCSCVEEGVGSAELQKFWRSDPLAHATGSLESLKILSFRRGGNGLLESLKMFPALKEVETELRLLIFPGDRPDKLLRLLPGSIEKLHLHTREGRLMVMPNIVKSILQAKSQLLPRLSMLRIQAERKSTNRSRVGKAMEFIEEGQEVEMDMEGKITTKSMIGKALESMKEEGQKVGIKLELIGF